MGDAKGVLDSIKAVLWDNDGVLVDTERLYFRATREILAGVGLDLTQELYVDLILRQARGAWHLLRERGVSEDEIAALRQARDARYAQLLGGESLVIDGVAEALASLDGRFVMGIVTSSRPEHFELIHRTSGLLRHFQFVLTAGDYTHYKPHPEPYLRGVERSGCAAAECIVVEDSERGLAAARAAGVRCLIVPNELTRDGDFSGAERVLGSVAEVAQLLLAVRPSRG